MISKVKSTLLIFVVLFISIDSYTQITHGGKPLKTPIDTSGNKVKHINVEVLLSKQQKSDSVPQYKSLKFGVSKEVLFTPENSGEWKTEGEIKYWRLIIKSPGAKSLNVLLNPFRLEPNVSLFIYNPEQTDIIGAITHLNNKKSGILPVTPVIGDVIVLELQMPASMKNYGEIQITKVGHDFIGILDGRNKDLILHDIKPCHVDINCKPEKMYQRNKYSVCRILILDKNEVCTGVLMNNARNDSTPYVLTAGHCIQNYGQAETSVFLFDYESPTCGGPSGSDKKTISGSELKAAKSNLDFILVELTETPPEDFKPYYAGWTLNTTDLDSTYSIHHPYGHVKKIGIDNDVVTTSTFNNMVSGSDWHIDIWEEGLTESGSSGSPLFNKNGRVIGTLTGGSKPAGCDFLGDDYYSKFSYQYNYYSDAINQLKHWLNPDEIIPDSIGYLDGFYAFDPEKYAVEWKSNIPDGTEFLAYKYANNNGYISGHNIYKHKEFAEKFKNTGLFTFNSVRFYTDRIYNGSDTSYIIIKVWDGEDVPGKLVAEKKVMLSDFVENSANEIGFDSLITVKDDFFVGFELEYYTKDTFVLKHSVLDNGQYKSFMVRQNNVWESVSSLINSTDTLNLAISFAVNDFYSPDTTYKRNDFLHKLWPNPARDYVMLYFPDFQKRNIQIKVYDLSGKLVLLENIPEFLSEYRINVQSLDLGIYQLQILIDNRLLISHKLLKY